MVDERHAGLLALIARRGLTDGDEDSCPVPALDSDAWNSLLTEVIAQRLTAQLMTLLAPDDAGVGQERFESARRAHFEARAYVLCLERTLLHTTSLLSSAGIRQLVLKGPAHAHLDYPSPADRAYGDLDLLVDHDNYIGAVSVLEGAGYRSLTCSGSGIEFEAEFDKGRSLASQEGLVVDLHHLLADPPYGLAVDTGQLFGHGQRFVVRGRQVRALGREERLLHSCLHAVIGGFPPRLVSLRDIVLQAGSGDLDWHRVRDLVERWRMAAALQLGNELAWSQLGLPAPPMDLSFIRGSDGTRRDRALLLAASWNDRRRNQALRFAALAATPGIRPRLRLLRGVLLLDRTELARRGGFTSRAGWWFYLARSVVSIVLRLVAHRLDQDGRSDLDA